MKQKEPTTLEEYRRRVNLATDYVRTHLKEPITIDILSEISAFSPFHFQRVISAFLGESIGSFVQRARLERAARLLTNTSMTISDVAYEVGYDSPSSLTKMFSRFFGVSPTTYRKTKTKNKTTMETQSATPEINLSKNPKIVDIATRNVIYITAKGDYKTVDYTNRIIRLWQEVKTQQLFTAGIETLVYYYNDPCVIDAEHLSCDVCLSIHKPATANEQVGVKSIEGGRYAMFTYIGEYDKLSVVYDLIYSEWFPTSGYKIGNRSCFEKYVSDPRKVAPDRCKTEIYISIE